VVAARRSTCEGPELALVPTTAAPADEAATTAVAGAGGGGPGAEAVTAEACTVVWLPLPEACPVATSAAGAVEEAEEGALRLRLITTLLLAFAPVTTLWSELNRSALAAIWDWNGFTCDDPVEASADVNAPGGLSNGRKGCCASSSFAVAVVGTAGGEAAAGEETVAPGWSSGSLTSFELSSFCLRWSAFTSKNVADEVDVLLGGR